MRKTSKDGRGKDVDLGQHRSLHAALRRFRAAQVTAPCPSSPIPDCFWDLPGHPINKSHGRGWGEQAVKQEALTPRLARLAHSVPNSQPQFA